ncbi:zinc-ribbon domain-containing protein [Ktedonosporobacter rubrisoli]|uniref:Zinc-ribbon domain-containing protein n=1 Tax=Ktedonosporobacter rubrisoli TaxID=2509675 RepID=A0A4P6K4E8_KTERU|nr:zinc-ribbon domain-containing protein [Ktedonosporobacter rubrisoli]
MNRTIHKAMALRPKDRYQSVADLANDLKRVMGALPAPQQPKRPVDPHSTQPDLPMLYEAIQAAKENAQQAPSTPDAVSQTAAVNYCPRCNAPLAPKAAFCAQCGTPLGPSTPPRSSASSKRIPEGEQTLLIRPQKNQASMMASQMVPPHSQTGSSQHSSATQTGTSENYQAPKAISTMVQAPQSITSSNTPSGPQGPVTTTGDIEPAARSGFHLDPKFLIIGLIALIMLIAIITLIITMTHHGH